MAFLFDRPIAVRIALLALLPFLAALWLASMQLGEQREAARTAAKLEHLMLLTASISEVVHDMQKERGLSAGFTGSKGQKFADMVPRQREETDLRVQRFDAELANFDFSEFDPAFEDEVRASRNALADIGTIRRRVSALDATVPQIAQFYTQRITALLTIVDEAGMMGQDADVLPQVIAYAALLQGKEKAGLERAMGATGFGAGRFSPDIYRRFIALGAGQDAYFSTFDTHATPSQSAYLGLALDGPDAKAVDAMREAAVASTVTGFVSGVDAERWWEEITGKINMMKQVEDSMTVDLVTLAADKRSAADAAFTTSLLVMLALGAIIVFLSLFVILSIVRPVKELCAATERMTAGDYDFAIDIRQSEDKIGALVARIKLFRTKLLESEIAQAAHAKERAEHTRLMEERAALVEQLTAGFDTTMTGALSVFAEASTSLNRAAQDLDNTARNTAERSVQVASASQQTSHNVKTVADATEELSLSIGEIVKQMGASASSVAAAVEQTRLANTDINELHQAAGEIGAIVSLIVQIAEQTNLLALNASIEAARAADQGLGFAVVAREIKGLAEQTAEASKGIVDHIGSVQRKTEQAVGAIHTISAKMSDMEHASLAISSALEQQSIAADSIARNIHEAASGTREVDFNIGDVQRATTDTKNTADNVVVAVTSFRSQADGLRGTVSDFLTRIKAA